MIGIWEQAKFRELRAKTDRQLLTLVNGCVESGFQSETAGNYAQAERAYYEAQRLLPLVYTLPAAERLRVEGRLAMLRQSLVASACA